MKPASAIQEDPLRVTLADLLRAGGADGSEELIDAILQCCGANALTDRHGDVLQLALRGLNDKEIAGALGIGEDMLCTHWRSIRERLGIYHRLQLGAFVAAAVLRKPVGCEKRRSPAR